MTRADPKGERSHRGSNRHADGVSSNRSVRRCHCGLPVRSDPLWWYACLADR